MNKKFFHKGRFHIICEDDPKVHISFCVDDAAYIYHTDEDLVITPNLECDFSVYRSIGSKLIYGAFLPLSALERIYGDTPDETHSRINCNGLEVTVILEHLHYQKCDIQSYNFIFPIGEDIYFDLGIDCIVPKDAPINIIKDFCHTDLVKEIFKTIRIEKN
jgi:hypothetical protein